MATQTCDTAVSCDCASFGLSAELSDSPSCSGSQGPTGPAGTDGASGNVNYVGTGDPNGVQTGNQGDGFKATDTGLFWIKTSAGSGNTGWE